MGRIRTVKPALFTHGDLFDAEQESGLPLRVAFIALFTCCDREGRFRWKPRELKLDCLPFDQVDFSRVLDALWTRGYLVKYAQNGAEYGCIPTFPKHQVINNRESMSELPEPTEATVVTREPRVPDATTTRLIPAQVEGKGREGNMEGEGNMEQRGGDASTVVEQPLNEQPTVVLSPSPSLSPVLSEGKERASIKLPVVHVPKVVAPLVYPSWATSRFIGEVWPLWKRYKAERRKTYRPIGEQAALSRLAREYATEQDAIDAIEYSIAQGYEGIFSLKNRSNGNTPHQPTTASHGEAAAVTRRLAILEGRRNELAGSDPDAAGPADGRG